MSLSKKVINLTKIYVNDIVSLSISPFYLEVGMVICSCRAVLGSKVLEKLKENPAAPLKELMEGNGKKECCKYCSQCVSEAKKIIAEHSAAIKRS